MTTESAEPRREQARYALEGAFSDLAAVVRRAHFESAERCSPGLSPTAYKAFSAILRHGPISLSDLSAHLVADKGMLSRAVSELEELGFVERTRSTNDRRIWLIDATATGRERFGAARGPLAEQFGRILDEWPVDDIERLTELLQALTRGTTP